MVNSLSQQSKYQSQESQDIIKKLQEKLLRYKEKSDECDIRRVRIEDNLKQIHHHQELLRTSTTHMATTLGQFTQLDSNEAQSSLSSTRSSDATPTFPSRFKRLNFAAAPDEDPFNSSSLETISVDSPLYCPIEEVSSIDGSSSPAQVAKKLPTSITVTSAIRKDKLPFFPKMPSNAHASCPTPSSGSLDSLDGDISHPKPEELKPTPHNNDELDQPCNATLHLSTQPRMVTQQTQGDTPDLKYEGDVRIISQNCRGAIQLDKSREEHYIPSIASFKDLLADVVLLSETNVDWRVRDNHYDTHLENRVIFSPAPVKTTTASCSWDNRARSSYQPGGVLSVFTNHVTPRIVSSTSDPYGRWVKTTIQVRQRNIVVFNTYRTHRKTLETAGCETPWMQQWVAHRKSTGNTSDPRAMHIDDLIQEIQIIQDNDDYVLIIGDFNEDILDAETSGIKRLQSETRLLQIYEHLHGLTPSSRQKKKFSHFHVSRARSICA